MIVSREYSHNKIYRFEEKMKIKYADSRKQNLLHIQYGRTMFFEMF